MTPSQLAMGVLIVLVTAMICAVTAFHRGAVRQWTYPVLCLVATLSILSWTNNLRFQTLLVDVDRSETPASTHTRVKQNRPFHFAEFVHYYLGPKYFSEVGYLGLYDCITLGDSEIASEDHRAPRISGYVRDLNDVLVDKPYDRALADCTREQRPRFSSERWASFKNDIRELARLVDDGAWPAVVFDAGFNPPPSFVVVSSAVTNLIPIASGTTPTFVIATALDLTLLLLCFAVLRVAFGRITSVLVPIYFGVTLLSHYSWTIGSVLRYTWFVSIVCGLAMMKRGRWTLAGVLLGAATCDRIFPIAFAAFALVPIAVRARTSTAHRVILRKFGIGFVAATTALVVISSIVFGLGVWRTFFARIGHHGDVYFVMHVGLKKVLTFRTWVTNTPFAGHDGLINFRNWNLRLRDTWAGMRPLVLPLQALVLAGTVWACARRRPYEAGMLGGVVFMFFFNLPANYYYVILTPIPALLFRAAATATTLERRFKSFAAFAVFNVFWVFTFVAPQLAPHMVIYNFYICCALGIALVIWIAVWVERRSLADLKALARVPFAAFAARSTDNNIRTVSASTGTDSDAPAPASTAPSSSAKGSSSSSKSKAKTKAKKATKTEV